MDPIDLTALNHLCATASKASGETLVQIVKQGLSHSNIYFFGELLDLPSVQALEQTNKGIVDLLKIFAYGTYADYKSASGLPTLNDGQLQKLKKLTIVSVCSQKKVIHYSELSKLLDITDLRALEDIVIDCIYQGLIKAKLDQKQKHLEVEFAIGRDLRPGQVEEMRSTLSEWCNNSEQLLRTIDEKIKFAEKAHQERRDHEAALKERIDNLKATLKVAMESEMADGTEDEERSRKKSGRKQVVAGARKGKGLFDFRYN